MAASEQNCNNNKIISIIIVIIYNNKLPIHCSVSSFICPKGKHRHFENQL